MNFPLRFRSELWLEFKLKFVFWLEFESIERERRWEGSTMDLGVPGAEPSTDSGTDIVIVVEIDTGDR